MGTTPPYLAGREPELARFRRIVAGYPEKRRNLRLTGLRGVGKTVLLKEYERIAAADEQREWVVIRRDLVPRMVDEAEFVSALSEYLREAAEALSLRTRVKNRLSKVLAAIRDIEVQVADGVTITGGPGRSATAHRTLEDRLRTAFVEVATLAGDTDKGLIMMFDEAHEVFDRPRAQQYPLSALLAAVVAAQDQESPPLPVMLVLCGLPPLVTNLHNARSHSERLFRAVQIDNLDTDPGEVELSEAELALVEPVAGGPIGYEPATARRIVREVDGYPYFIQWFGEALWDAARDAGTQSIDAELYASSRRLIRNSLDVEFFEGRYRDAREADRLTLRVAASLGGEQFAVADLNSALTERNANANAQSLQRLVQDNIIFRLRHGRYAYTAPLFGDFVRREHPLGQV